MNKEQFIPSESENPGCAIVISGGALLEEAHLLMDAERLSAGGNIRDKSVEDLEQLSGNGGKIWGWLEGDRLLSVFTTEEVAGWTYLNNGVTHPEARGRGIVGTLLTRAMEADPRGQFIVIYVRQGLFERLGFTEVTADGLVEIDPMIGTIIRNKLRHGKEAHIFIKR